ncbi:uncharacterized protein LOC128725568 [Anopheles nili]|uniref:uncharacterized protein LOC128725568 n=1 Tax=Anopheles nili TaxID=185578 RepID=UPI00237AE5D3|nr:uncharacterized protein LOC128725568 [Anopheles nili]
MQKQRQLIKQFPLPNELKDGIVYLQRALRDCVLQHQILASKINILPMHQRAKVKEYMLELEGEMLSIGKEQEGLVRHLSARVKRFQLHMQTRKMISIADELLYGHVSNQLNTHHEMAHFKISPKHISPRLNASELSQKYCLEAILMHHGTAVQDEPEGGLEDEAAQPEPWTDEPKPSKKKLKKAVTKTYLKSANVTPTPSPVHASSGSQRSLLKVKQERRSESPLVATKRSFAGLTEQKPTLGGAGKPANVKEKVEPVSPERSSEEDELEDEEEEDEDDREQSQKQSSSTARSTGSVWVPGLRGRPPKGVKYRPVAKQATVEAQRQPEQPVPVGKSTIQKRASKRKDVLEEKIDPEQEDSGEEQAAAHLPMSAAVRRCRSNLLQALKRQKRLSGKPSVEQEKQQAGSTVTGAGSGRTTSKRAAPSGKLVKHASSGSSGSSPNSRSSTPTWGLRPGSEDLSDQRSSSGEFPPLPDAGEPPVPTPSSIYELEQPVFLRFFGLFTPDEIKAVRERKRERKRRSCYSTERKDFHYGKLDYCDQQQQYQAVRATKKTHQRPILYSPPVAVAKKRKLPPPPPQTMSHETTAGGPLRHRQPSPANIFAAMDNRSCFVCHKSGSTDELSACMNCCNIYHLNCHKIDDGSEAYRQRDNLCPVCLTSDDGEK